jgi:hypothetical protein
VLSERTYSRLASTPSSTACEQKHYAVRVFALLVGQGDAGAVGKLCESNHEGGKETTKKRQNPAEEKVVAGDGTRSYDGTQYNSANGTQSDGPNRTQSKVANEVQSKCTVNGKQCDDPNDKLRNMDSNSVAVIVRGCSSTVSGKKSRRGRRANRAVRQSLTLATPDFALENVLTDGGDNASAELALHCTAVARGRSPLGGDKYAQT